VRARRVRNTAACRLGAHPVTVAVMPNRKFTAVRRRAHELLASRPDGCSEALMLAHGFPASLLIEMVRDGLATAAPERMMAGNRALEVTRLQITDAGWKALGR
jgi:hypothetical protein